MRRVNLAIQQILFAPNPDPVRAARAGLRHGLARPGSAVGETALYETRISNRDARRREALHVGLRPEGRVAEISDNDDTHALQRRALRSRQLPRLARSIAEVYGRGLHLRLSGRAWTKYVGRRIRLDARS